MRERGASDRRHRRRLTGQRLWRRVRRYTNAADLLDVVLLGLAIGLAINATSVSAVVTAILGTLYLVVLVLKLSLTFRTRKAVDRLHGEVLWGLFDLFNEQLFGNDCYVRFTLFRVDPLDASFIVPWYRYERGGSDAISDAERSFARYAKGEGFTGKAWQESGNNQFSLAVIDRKFSSRGDFERYYSQELRIDEELVKHLSEYMEHVGVILSAGFCDARGKFLGVVSIDLQWTSDSASDDGREDDEGEEVDEIAFVAPDGEVRTLDFEKFATVAISLHNVLRSLAESERR